MNKLSTEKRVQILRCLVEGNSLRATARMVDVAINSVVKLLIDAGKACAKYQDKALRNLTCTRIQCDEIWSFCYAKDANLPEDKIDKFGFGSVWTWTAIDADTKLVCSWLVSSRDAGAAYPRMKRMPVSASANCPAPTKSGKNWRVET